ncbi:MAG: DUF3572 family protein [Alphaproteobacteria bacterium]|nr:DUF3572 family protein [Alphaproteobacteria bacterium]
MKRNQNFSSSKAPSRSGASGAARERAEGLAIEALGFLAGDAERLSRFLDLSGLTPQTLREAATQPSFLGAVLDYLAADESLLVTFAANGGHNPADILSAHALLSPHHEGGAL